MVCRWFGYSRTINQPVPCLHGSKETLPPADAAAVDRSGNNPRMPTGFVSEDPWGDPDDARLLKSEAVDTPVATWTTDNVLKWSALERLCRGEKAKRLTAQVLTMTAMRSACRLMFLPIAVQCRHHQPRMTLVQVSSSSRSVHTDLGMQECCTPCHSFTIRRCARGVSALWQGLETIPAWITT